MTRIGILHQPKVPASKVLAEDVAAYLRNQDYDYYIASAWDTTTVKAELPNTTMAITIGGDGTLLRVGRLSASYRIPLLGVNMGRIGFLAELRPTEVMEQLPLLLEGQGWIEERMLLRTRVISTGHHEEETETTPLGLRVGLHVENQPLGENVVSPPLEPVHSLTGTYRDEEGYYEALNDVVVARGAGIHVVRVTAYVDGDELTTYTSDGLIIATASGSTAYSHAAGGPILDPQLRAILLTPIASHLSITPSLVLPDDAHIRLVVATNYDALFSVDGQENIPLHNGAEVEIMASPYSCRFLRLRPRPYFYRTLTQRLRGY